MKIAGKMRIIRLETEGNNRDSDKSFKWGDHRLMKYSVEPYKGMTDRLFWLFILIAAAVAAVFLFVLF